MSKTNEKNFEKKTGIYHEHLVWRNSIKIIDRKNIENK